VYQGFHGNHDARPALTLRLAGKAPNYERDDQDCWHWQPRCNLSSIGERAGVRQTRPYRTTSQSCDQMAGPFRVIALTYWQSESTEWHWSSTWRTKQSSASVPPSPSESPPSTSVELMALRPFHTEPGLNRCHQRCCRRSPSSNWNPMLLPWLSPANSDNWCQMVFLAYPLLSSLPPVRYYADDRKYKPSPQIPFPRPLQRLNFHRHCTVQVRWSWISTLE